MLSTRSFVLWAAVTTIATLSIAAMGMLLYYRYLAERPLPPPDSAPTVAVTAPLTERVVLIVLDSLREDTATDPAVMPHFIAHAARGAGGVNITPQMTLTTMSVFTTATGMEPSISWSLKNFDAEPFTDESIISVVAASGRKVALLGDASWAQMFGGSAANVLAFKDKGFFAAEEGGITADDRTTMATAEAVLRDPAYALVIIHLTSSDKAAHRFGAHRVEEDGSPSAYAQALTTFDTWLGDVIGRNSEATTWLLMSDHGCTLRGNHGGGEPEARRAPFALFGAGVVVTPNVEQTMTSLAPTIAALFGLRPPRTSEVAASLDLLALSARDRADLSRAQLATREAFVKGYLAASELEPDLAAGTGLESLRLAMRAVDDSFGWLRVAGLGLGMTAQALLVLMLGLVIGWPRPWIAAVGWALLSWALLFFEQWQFPSIQLFGELTKTPGGFVVRIGILAALFGGLRIAARRLRDNHAVAWITFFFLVLLLSQSALRWPYGPLTEMYRAMLLLGLGLAAWYGPNRKALIGAAGVLVALFVGIDQVLEHALHEKEAVPALLWVANGLLLGLVGVLALNAKPRNTAERALWAGLLMLAIGSMVYREVGSPWLIKLLIGALIVPVIVVGRGLGSLRAARNATMVVALILYRALSIDARVIILIAVTAAAVLVSTAAPRNRVWAAPLVAGFAVLLHQSYFFESGYSYSFSALDMNVAFAATRDAIDLGEGFVLLNLQALGPWLIAAACVLYNRAAVGDELGARATVIALIGVFVVQAWGAFASFGYEIDNHWFTMHAVPLIVFSLCSAMLAGLATVATMPLASKARLNQS